MSKKNKTKITTFDQKTHCTKSEWQTVTTADGSTDGRRRSLTRRLKVIYATCTSKNTVDVHVFICCVCHWPQKQAAGSSLSVVLDSCPSSESHINKTCHQDPPSAASKTSPDSDLHSRVSETLFHITLRLHDMESSSESCPPRASTYPQTPSPAYHFTYKLFYHVSPRPSSTVPDLLRKHNPSWNL